MKLKKIKVKTKINSKIVEIKNIISKLKEN